MAAERTVLDLERWARENEYRVSTDAKPDGTWVVSLNAAANGHMGSRSFSGTASQRGITPQRAYSKALLVAVSKAEAFEGRTR